MRCGAGRVVLRQRPERQLPRSPYPAKTYSHVFFTFFDFRLTLFALQAAKAQRFARVVGYSACFSAASHDARTATHIAASPQGASPALEHRVIAGFWRARQLFRSRESFRVARCASDSVWNVRRDVRLFVQRVQLDLRGAATAFRIVAGSFWRAPRRRPQHDHLEHRVLRRGHFHRSRKLI